MTYQQFVSDPGFRRTYWARNHVGWRHVHETRPNAGHAAIARMEARGVVESTEGFRVVDCEGCGGLLEPDITYFGEAVPADRLAAARALVTGAEGSSWPGRP